MTRQSDAIRFELPPALSKYGMELSYSAADSCKEWDSWDVRRAWRGERTTVATLTLFIPARHIPANGLMQVYSRGDNSPANCKARAGLVAALADTDLLIGPFSDDYFRQFSEYGPRAANNYPVGVC